MTKYLKLGPYIVDQLFPYQEANKIIENVEHIAEGFGVTSDYSEDGVPSVQLKGASSAITFYTNAYEMGYDPVQGEVSMEPMTAGSEDVTRLELDGYYLKGDRAMLTFQADYNDDEPYGSTRSSSLDMGYVMTRPGSVLSMSLAVYVNSALIAGQELHLDLEKNGAAFISGSKTGAVTVNNQYGVTDKYTRGVHTFAAGDRLETQFMWFEVGLGNMEANAVGCVEVILDE